MHDGSMKNVEGEMDEVRRAEAELDARVIRVLEGVPEVRVPADFAARVAGMVPARQVAATVRVTRFGYKAMAGSMVVLLLAMVLLAPQTMGHGAMGVVLEWTLCGQFVLLALWWSVWERRVR
jgi:hypothetical protein